MEKNMEILEGFIFFNGNIYFYYDMNGLVGREK